MAVDVWDRPFFTLVSSIPANVPLSGFATYIVAKLTTVAVVAVTAWLTFQLARAYRLERPALVIPLLCLQALRVSAVEPNERGASVCTAPRLRTLVAAPRAGGWCADGGVAAHARTARGVSPAPGVGVVGSDRSTFAALQAGPARLDLCARHRARALVVYGSADHAGSAFPGAQLARALFFPRAVLAELRTGGLGGIRDVLHKVLRNDLLLWNEILGIALGGSVCARPGGCPSAARDSLRAMVLALVVFCAQLIGGPIGFLDGRGAERVRVCGARDRTGDLRWLNAIADAFSNVAHPRFLTLAAGVVLSIALVGDVAFAAPPRRALASGDQFAAR